MVRHHTYLFFLYFAGMLVVFMTSQG